MSAVRKLRRFAKRRTAITTPIEAPIYVERNGVLSGMTRRAVTRAVDKAVKRGA